MKLFTTILTATCIFAAISTAEAQPGKQGPYVSGFIGVSVPKDANIFTTESGTPYNDTVSFDTGINTGVTGGYDFGYARLEGELSYKHASISGIKDSNSGSTYNNVDGEAGVLATMFNVFFDLKNNSPVTPYFGGGIGVATVYISNTYSDSGRMYREDNDTVFAYQLGVGAEIALRPRYSLDIGYRYFNTDKASFTDYHYQSNGWKMESHNVSVGFRIKF